MARHQGKEIGLGSYNTKRLQNIGKNTEMIMLLKWMKCNGFARQQLRPAIFEETGRGLMANVSFKPGETIISVPACLLITTSTVLRSSIGPVVKKHRELTPRQILCVFLIVERHKGPASFWNAYISQLPDIYTTPAYFTDAEINILPQHLQNSAINQRETVNDEFQKVKLFSVHLKSLDPVLASLFVFETFRWAWFVVNTRSVYIDPYVSQWKCSCEIDSYALAPFLDLLNHSATAVVTAGFNLTSNCYEIQTHNRYQKYDQVFISYGPHGNEKLLLEYGFIVPENHNTTVHIPLELIVECVKNYQSHTMCTSNIETKIKFLKEESLLLDKLTCGYEGVSWSMIITLRILSTDTNKRNHWQRMIAGQEPTTVTELKLIKGIVGEVLESLKVKILEKIRMCATGGHYSLIRNFMQEQLHIVSISIKGIDQIAGLF